MDIFFKSNEKDKWICLFTLYAKNKFSIFVSSNLFFSKKYLALPIIAGYFIKIMYKKYITESNAKIDINL